MQKILGYVRRAVQEFDLLENGDRVAVGVSGGKDSVVMLKALVLLRRFIGIDYEIVAITLDPRFGGEPGDYSCIEEMCREMGIEFVLIDTHIGEIVFEIGRAHV